MCVCPVAFLRGADDDVSLYKCYLSVLLVLKIYKHVVSAAVAGAATAVVLLLYTAV